MLTTDVPFAVTSLMVTELLFAIVTGVVGAMFVAVMATSLRNALLIDESVAEAL